MSGKPVSHDDHPPHGHPENTSPSTQKSDKPSTASHPPDSKPDPTTSAPHPKFHPPTGATGSHDTPTASTSADNAEGRQSATDASGSTELARLKVSLRSALRQFPDFPAPGILFEDIMPIFASNAHFNSLVRALELLVAERFATKTGEASKVDVVVGLESRGFLFGPTLALRLGAGFVPVRKEGKLPGGVVTEEYKKEYGVDRFQMQEGAIKQGQKVIIVDDIIATGGSAAAAGSLVRKLGGDLLGYVFMMELDFLKGRDKLDAPVHTLLTGQEEGLEAQREKLPLGQTKEKAEDVKPVQDAGGAAAETRP